MVKRAFLLAVKAVFVATLVAVLLGILIARISRPPDSPPSIRGHWRELRPPDFD